MSALKWSAFFSSGMLFSFVVVVLADVAAVQTKSTNVILFWFLPCASHETALLPRFIVFMATNSMIFLFIYLHVNLESSLLTSPVTRTYPAAVCLFITSVTSDNMNTLTSHCLIFSCIHSLRVVVGNQYLVFFLSQWASHYLHQQKLLISPGHVG